MVVCRPRGRAAFIVLLAVFLGGASLASVAAQSATPALGGVPGSQAPGPVATPGGTLPGNPKVQLVKVADGFYNPVNVAAPDDGSGRLFVVDRVGYLWIVDKAGKRLPTPFLDLTSVVKTDFLEQGLLGLAFHPNYKQNGLFYVLYNDYVTSGSDFLVQYKVSAGDPNTADPNSAQLLIAQPKPYVNHNGGTVHFGPDGDLYWTMGDGGLAGDPYDNAQRYDTLLGKVLRIRVPAANGQGYAIPPDNPFAKTGVVLPSEQASKMAQDGSYHPIARRELCDWGLRNPWQFAFDPKTGDLYVADVGQNTWEEVDFAPAGQVCGHNFGWDFNEGGHCYPPSEQTCDKIGTLPVANYNHLQGDCSIAGIGVYRGAASPSLDGIYFNSDFCSGKVYGLERGQDGRWQYQVLLRTSLKVLGAGQDPSGELYLTSCPGCKYSMSYRPLTEAPTGAVWRIVQADKVPAGAQTPPSGTPSPIG
jgi:glucose/arabinose dehydrogenase